MIDNLNILFMFLRNHFQSIFLKNICMKTLHQENNKWRKLCQIITEKAMYMGKYYTNKDNQHSYYVLTAYSYACI